MHSPTGRISPHLRALAAAMAVLLAAAAPAPPDHAQAPRTHKTERKARHKVPVVKAPHSRKSVRPKAPQPASPPAAAVAPGAAAAAAAAAPKETVPAKGSDTGLPLPRFAALRSDDVNMRVGPDTRYPIEWVYKRRDLPVEIVREFQMWRLVKDPDGIKGWVHQATLTGRRTFIVVGGEQKLRGGKEATSDVVALLKPGVIGRILACDAGADACRVQVHDYRGYLSRSAVWGLLPGEVITPG